MRQLTLYKNHLLIGVALLLAVLTGVWLVDSPPPLTPKNVASYQQQRILRFAYEITNTTAEAIPNASFSSYLPVEQMANQQALEIKASRPLNEKSGQLGNRIGQVNLGLIPPYGKKTLNLVAKMNMAVTPNPVALAAPDIYLKAETFIESDHPRILQLSQGLKGTSPQDSIKKIYHWASTRIRYSGYTAQDHGALYAITKQRGDCTEYMYTVVALARALGIPARGIGGYVYSDNQVVTPADYHNWAEVYLDGTWQIVDAQKKVLMTQSQDYIALRILSDASVSLLGSSHRFSVADKALRITMN